MKITKLEIHNYRNLDGVKISLEENCNFIVGENNLGKSNLLTLINILFTSRAFKLDDFKDVSLPIEINFQLKLAPIEIGHFQDLFDLDDYSLINITARQDNIDDNIIFFHTETTTYIQPSVVKCLNYIHYDSLRNPVAEINFDKGRGVGRFLRNIISQYLKNNGISDADFLDDTKVTELLGSINDKIVKIKSFQDFGIKASTEDDAENLLSKIVVLKDGKGDSFLKTGYGVQFLILVTLSVLEKLQAIRAQRGNRGIFENEANGEKSISLIIGLDEPEIHLHPYMQRSLIKYLNSVITNNNAEFRTLIKELFDIDEFIGQIIVVTHSPNILLNDYKQIIRFYSESGVTKIISGSQFTLGEQLHKHLYLHFPFIKEAFFSRCAIFVEGDSEFSSFPLFGKKLSIEFDDLGICVIQAGGDAIHQLIELATKFGIPSIGISDKDNGTSPTALPNHFQTDLRDYEEEIVCRLIDSGKEELLRNILKDKDERWLTRKLEKDSLNKRLFSKSGQDKYNLGISKFEVDLILTNIELDDLISLKSFYLTWFILNKSYPLGMLIGEHLTIAEIPVIYQTVINEAKKLVTNV
jgi:putative ATP-dependent endonuclease of OLD family